MLANGISNLAGFYEAKPDALSKGTHPHAVYLRKRHEGVWGGEPDHMTKDASLATVPMPTLASIN